MIGALTAASLLGTDNSEKISLEAQASEMVTETLNHATYYGTGDFDWASEGKLEFDCGDTYTGGLSFGDLNGTGTYTYKNIGTYKGDFDLGQRAGEGTFTWKDGSTYSGDWYDDCMDGEGVYQSVKKGIKLKGIFYGNKFTDGALVYKKNGNVYQYRIEDGKFTNKIYIKYKNGSQYTGTYTKTKLTGTGTIRYKNGDRYSGKLKDGKKSGTGTYRWKNGASYKGSWKNERIIIILHPEANGFRVHL